MKGKVVKTFSAYVPQPDLSKVPTRISVRFHAKSGDFEIYLPEHLALAVDGHESLRHYRIGKVTVALPCGVRASTLTEVERAFNACCSAYLEILKSEQRKRVIFIQYKRNRVITDRFGRRDEQIHWGPTPCFGLEYEVLWQAGNRLYRQFDAESPLQDAGVAADPHEGSYVIEWTPEREEFIQRLYDNLCGLIDRLDTFMGDVAGNIDLAIATGSGPLLLQE